MPAALTLVIPMLVPCLGPIPAAGDPPPAPPAELLRDALEERGLEAVWQVGTPVEGLSACWQAPNRAVGMRTLFTPAGVVVAPREGRGWSLGMRLSALERGALRAQLEEAHLEVRGARAEYRRGEILEMYANEAGGLHQAFELGQRPLPGGAGPLRLVLEIGGGLVASPAGPYGARFTAPDGSGAVTWSGLRAWDASGHPLEACVRVEQSRLSIEVDDERALYPVTVDPVIVTELQKLVALDAAQGATMGEAVALEGSTLVAGATRDASAGSFTGAVYVFHWDGTTWAQQQKLLASDAMSGDQFGLAVDISGDRILVGSDADGAAGQLAGQVYVFLRQGGAWVEEARFQPLDAQMGDVFGRAVAIDGDRMVVGARGNSDSFPNSGAAYIFERGATGWQQMVKLYAPDAQGNELFGGAVAVHGDTVLVGAYLASFTGMFEGAAYVFTGSGSSWAHQQKLVASDGVDHDQFGRPVELFGNTAIVGARGRDDLGPASGAAYVYHRTGSTWTEVQKLLASDGAAGDIFGAALDLEEDLLIVGAPNHDALGSNAGAAYLFQRLGGQWSEVAKLQASDGAAGHALGHGVGISGPWAAAGAPNEASAAPAAGALYVYQTFPGTPYCFGDGTGTPCPCGNAGTTGQGCANSSGQGALLTALGSSSVSADDLQLGAANLLPPQFALLFCADEALNGGDGVVFGDGLRCAGVNVRRLGAVQASGTGSASWGPGLGALGGWSAGATRRFQVWYRDALASVCGSGFNLSNGVEVVFIP